MKITIRPAVIEDAEVCGRICYNAFGALAKEYNYPSDCPSVKAGIELFSKQLLHPEFYTFVAEVDGQVVASISVSERASIAGISLIIVDPTVQNSTIGRQLIQYGLERIKGRFKGAMLAQASYHLRSFCLYVKLGFQAREMLSAMQGPALNLQLPGYSVRPATPDDLEACTILCIKIYGYDRSNELENAIQRGEATVVVHHGHISGYATQIGFFEHAVGKTNEDLKALIGAASEFLGPGFVVPTRNDELFRWCLEHKLRLVVQMTLMSYGQYHEPKGPYLPSIFC